MVIWGRILSTPCYAVWTQKGALKSKLQLFAQVMSPLAFAKCHNSAIIMKNGCISSLFYPTTVLFSQESTENPGQLCTWQRTTRRLEHPLLETAWGWPSGPSPLPNLKEYATVSLTTVVTYVGMCLNSCFSSSYGLEHCIRSHRCALLAWKLEGGQGELRSKIKPAASHPLLIFRKRYLYLAAGSHWSAQCLACGQLPLVASPTDPLRSGSHRISGKLDNDRTSVQFILWQPSYSGSTALYLGLLINFYITLCSMHFYE